MRVVSIALCAALSLIGTAAGAAELEARNPFHCSLAMQVAYDLAKQARGAEDPLSKELHGRLVYQAFAAARFPKALDADQDAASIRAQLAQDGDAAFALTEACMLRQDATPRFRQARLEKQIAENFSQVPVAVHASLAELKQLFKVQR
jgi:hypothetical protein